jgi:IS605 OrfB family transposase
LIAPVKLILAPDQKVRLIATMEQVNAACTWLAAQAFERKIVNKFDLQKRFYRDLRDRFGLSAQHAVRSLAKVCAAYKRDPKRCCTFRPHGSIAFDQRTYTFKNDLESVSLLAFDGRVIVPCAIGDHQRKLLEGKRGQAQLILRDHDLYLYVSVEVPRPEVQSVQDWLGVDLGIVNLAIDSDGKVQSGKETRKHRRKTQKLRSALQRKGTKSAKRHLKKMRRREQSFHRHTNHVLSKKIVSKAKDTGRGVALEDLEGIRDRGTVSKALRVELHGWSFHQLREFITYKGARAGVPLAVVDPRNTSRTCPECGFVHKGNRRSQAVFLCLRCGFTGHADHVAARNIAARARVNGPIVANEEVVVSHGVQLQSPAL